MAKNKAHRGLKTPHVDGVLEENPGPVIPNFESTLTGQLRPVDLDIAESPYRETVLGIGWPLKTPDAMRELDGAGLSWELTVHSRDCVCFHAIFCVIFFRPSNS